MNEYQCCIYTQDSVTKSITLSVVELGGSEKMSYENAMATFNQLGLDANEIFKIEKEAIWYVIVKNSEMGLHP